MSITQNKRALQSLCAPAFLQSRFWHATTGRSLVVFATRDDKSQCAAKVLEAIQTFFNYVEACGVAMPDRSIVSEGRARTNRDSCFPQETFGEIVRIEP